MGAGIRQSDEKQWRGEEGEEGGGRDKAVWGAEK